MTRLRKRRNHSYLLMLTVLTLVKTCWTYDGRISRKFPGSSNELEIVIGTSADPESLQYYLAHWNESTHSSGTEDDTDYLGEGLPEVLFHSENNSLILTDLSRCLYDFRFVTCLKFLLVNRLDNLLDYMKDNNLTTTNFSFMNGVVNFKIAPGVNHYEENREVLDLDEDISQKMMELFKDRSLQVNLLPGVGMDVTPVPKEKDFIGFKARPYLKWPFWRKDGDVEESEGRGRNKRKKGGFQMPSMMMLPQLIMWGFMPFALANLQAMVMNAFMLNMMALNSAIFMTIRNLVFGPRGGPKIKYVNYGYRKKKKSKVPTLIIHSPAAFVKQPFHHRKRPNRHGPPLKPHPHFHHHVHQESIIHEFPDSHSHFHHPVENNLHNDYGNTAGEFDYQYQGEEELPLATGVRVFKEDGHLDGKNRVRIRIGSEGPSVREVLHRVRDIEEKYQTQASSGEGTPGVPFGHFPDDTPWTVSDDSTSHGYGNTRTSQINYNREGEDDVMNYDQNEFTPIITYPKKLVRN